VAELNWLAHVFLSTENVEFKLGNLLADLVRGPERVGLSTEFLRGVQCHKAIDSFTDAHPLVRRSRGRIGASHRRFSGVLVDIFYDHVLATHWTQYCAVPLRTFTADFYADVGANTMSFPTHAQTTLDRIVMYDLLGAYQHVDGVRHSLQRLSLYLTSRWRKPFALDEAVSELIAHEAGFTADFEEFFPELRAHVKELVS
jgi:acyl carrier protein phosphodiesterase